MYIQCIYLSLILDIEFDEWNEYPYNLERKPFKTVCKCDEWGVSDVGDLALVTIYRCRWQNFDVSGNLLILVTKMASIVNISKLSPTHFVSNIDVTDEWMWRTCYKCDNLRCDKCYKFHRTKWLWFWWFLREWFFLSYFQAV